MSDKAILIEGWGGGLALIIGGQRYAWQFYAVQFRGKQYAFGFFNLPAKRIERMALYPLQQYQGIGIKEWGEIRLSNTERELLIKLHKDEPADLMMARITDTEPEFDMLLSEEAMLFSLIERERTRLGALVPIED